MSDPALAYIYAVREHFDARTVYINLAKIYAMNGFYIRFYIYKMTVPGFRPYRYSLDLATAQAVTGLKLVNATATGI